MDAFSYTNIFETKGIEYLIIIGFLILVIPFWKIITKPVVRQKLKEVVGILSEKILRIPRGLQYSRNHTWAHLNRSGDALIGIDDLLNHVVGKVEIDTFHESGDLIKRGDKLAELKQDGKKLEIVSPISGKLLGYNSKLGSDPTLINSEPYERGWLANIEPNSWIKESSDFITGDDAINWEKNEFLKFKDFMTYAVQKHTGISEKLILHEGGEIIDNPLCEMGQDVWSEFQKQFLNI